MVWADNSMEERKDDMKRLRLHLNVRWKEKEAILQISKIINKLDKRFKRFQLKAIWFMSQGMDATRYGRPIVLKEKKNNI